MAGAVDDEHGVAEAGDERHHPGPFGLRRSSLGLEIDGQLLELHAARLEVVVGRLELLDGRLLPVRPVLERVELDVRAVEHYGQPAREGRLARAARPDDGDSRSELHSATCTLSRVSTGSSPSGPRFARALDRLQPLLLNYASAGQAWREHGITADQVRAVNAAIEDGSPALWKLAQHLIDDAVTRGWLPETGR